MNTVSVPVTLSGVDNNALEAFMNYVKCSTCSILNYENDYISEFVAVKSFLLEILWTLNKNNSNDYDFDHVNKDFNNQQ